MESVGTSIFERIEHAFPNVYLPLVPIIPSKHSEHGGANSIQRCRERKRLALSIKQLETDPLLETLDTLMPVQTQVSDFFFNWRVTSRLM